MTRSYCDRCGKDITGWEQANVSVILFDMNGVDLQANGPMKAGDAELCMPCAALVDEALRPLNKEGK